MSMRARRTFTLLVSLGAVASVATACGSSGGGAGGGLAINSAAPSVAATATQNDALKAVCAAGAKEGSINYWSDQEPETWAKEVTTFESENPGIKVNFTQLEPQDQVSRAETEIQAGNISADVLGPDPESSLPMFDKGQIAPIDLSKYGLPTDLAVTIDGTQVWVTQRDFHGIAYNTTMYKASDLPDTWEALATDTALKGKMSVDPRAKWIAPIAQNSAWGVDKTVAWYKTLLANLKPVVLKGVTDSLTKVISGEIPVTTSARNAEVEQQAAGGAPVAIKYLDIVPVDEVVGVQLKGAPHPNAATCFLAWLAGPESQAAEFKYEFKTNAPKPQGMPATSTITNDTTQANINLIADATKKMAALTKP